MTKKKLILGILVFAFGIMITACGSKSNTSNTSPAAADDTQIPKNFDDASDCSNCIMTYDGHMAVLDRNLYLQAFGYQSGSDIISVGNSVFDNIFQTILAPAAGVLVCGTQMWLTEQAARLMGVQNVDFSCTQEDINIFGNGVTSVGGVQVANSYAARIRVQMRNGQADAIELTIDSNLNNGNDDVEVFYNQGSGVFMNTERTLILQNADGRIRFATSNSRVIGEFTLN